MFWTCNHGFLHVPVLYGDNPRYTLALLDESCSAMESSVGHAHLLTSVQDDGNPVAFLVVVHNAVNVRSRTVFSTSTKNASCPNSLSLGSLHLTDLHGSKIALR